VWFYFLVVYFWWLMGVGGGGWLVWGFILVGVLGWEGGGLGGEVVRG